MSFFPILTTFSSISWSALVFEKILYVELNPAIKISNNGQGDCHFKFKIWDFYKKKNLKWTFFIGIFQQKFNYLISISLNY